MKRDMDLIRDILLYIEEHQKNRDRIFLRVDGEKYSQDELRYHQDLLLDAGYIDGERVSGFGAATHTIRGMTWEGHDLLEAIRSDDVWKGTKKRLAKVGGSASIEVIKEVAVEVARSLLQ